MTQIIPLLSSLTLIFFQGVASSNVFSKPPCFKTPSIYGKWQIIKATQNGKKVFVPKKKGGVIMKFFSVEDSASDYEVSISAKNVFGTSMNITGKIEDCYNTIKVGPVIGTEMLPPKNYRPIENFISSHFRNTQTMKVDMAFYDRTLTMKGNNAILISRYIPSPDEYKGHWKILSASDNKGNTVPLPEDKNVIMEFENIVTNPQIYRWSTEVTNSFFTNVNVVRSVKSTKNDEYDVIEAGPSVHRTLTEPGPGDQALENFLRTKLFYMNIMYVNKAKQGENDMLVMSGYTAQLTAERYDSSSPIPAVKMVGYSGRWRVTEATKNAISITYPDDLDVMIVFMPKYGKPAVYNMNIMAFNTFYFDVEMSGYGYRGDYEYDVVDVKSVGRTNTVYSEEYDAIEGFFRTALEDVEQTSLNKDTLVMKGKRVELRAYRADPPLN